MTKKHEKFEQHLKRVQGIPTPTEIEKNRVKLSEAARKFFEQFPDLKIADFDKRRALEGESGEFQVVNNDLHRIISEGHPPNLEVEKHDFDDWVYADFGDFFKPYAAGCDVEDFKKYPHIVVAGRDDPGGPVHSWERWRMKWTS